MLLIFNLVFFFFFQAEDGIRDVAVTEFRRVLFRSLANALAQNSAYFCRMVGSTFGPAQAWASTRRGSIQSTSSSSTLMWELQTFWTTIPFRATTDCNWNSASGFPTARL